MKILFRVLMLVLLVTVSNANAAPNVSVVFVMDESGSVSSGNFLLEKQGFINALSGVPTDGGVEVSAIGFASSSSVLVNRTVLTSASFPSIKTALENNSQSGGGTAMDSAISTAASVLSGSTAPSKIICLATDGQPNSASATTSAANNAKAAGINLAPVGIGLNSSGRTFLDSIASNPPVPNPATFTEFATVVRNDCIGAVKSALNIQMIPESVNFGTFSENSLTSDIQLCSNTESIGVLNKSNQPAQITKVEIVGQDASAYELVSFMGVTPDKLTFPLTLSPGVLTEAKVRLSPSAPTGIPGDSSLDAVLNVLGKDSQDIEGTFSTDLVATVDASADDCLALNVMDASPTVHSISDLGEPKKEDGTSVGEIDVALTMQNDAQGDLERKGVVADGNARLLLVAKTRKPSGKVRFEITAPAMTDAKLYSLQYAPTYKAMSGSKQYDDTGKTSIDLDISTNPDGNGQVTAILRAGEHFLGGVSDAKVDFDIKVCILDSSGNCSSVVRDKQLEERKVPVILIHGLWSDNNSWFDANNRSEGMQPRLQQAGFIVRSINYDGNEGPAITVRSSKLAIQNLIHVLCNNVMGKQLKIACSRVDFVGHSMGGLFAREFIRLGYHNEDVNESISMRTISFGQGAIRRLITLGTPHFGSPMANVLFADTIFQSLPKNQKGDTSKVARLVNNNSFINDCIIHPESSHFDSDGGYDEVNDVVVNLGGANKFVRSGIENLVVGSAFQNRINSSESEIDVPILVVAGDIGRNYDQSLLVGSVAGGAINNIRPFTIGNVEKAGCDYGDVLSVDSDGIVPLDSALGINGFLDRYPTLGGRYNINGKLSRTLSGFNHTGMGQVHPYLNDEGQMDIGREDLRMIEQVVEYLVVKLPEN